MDLKQHAARKLIYTKQGAKWLAQFDPLDQETAKLLVSSLTLVSHTEFRRNIESQLHDVSQKYSGTVGLYAVRELKREKVDLYSRGAVIPFFQQVTTSEDGKSVNAVGSTSDQGSEALIAQIIRQISKADPSKFLNHPSKEELRAQKCDALIFVDDFIGSGQRVSDFIESFWQDSTVVSWLSSKHIKIEVLAYSGSEFGLKHLQGIKSRPEVNIYRDAPSFKTLPLKLERREALLELCEKYGRIALKGRKHVWWGFKQGMTALVFEHGCPNNTPAILWDPDDRNGKWIGLFPNRTVDASTASVFPPEIVRGETAKTLSDVGQTRLAKSGSLMRRGEAGRVILVVLGLIAKGQRKRSAICYATGLNLKDCEMILSKCIKWQFLTPERRMTPRGLAELVAARRTPLFPKRILETGSDYYYPRTLRGTAY